MLKAAVYARYSSSLQRPTSIEDQIARCRESAARFGCEIADEHIYSDQEISGATAQRPGYQRLTEAAKRLEFDAIIVEDQDRLWRDQAEMHAALNRLRFRGTKVFSVATGTNLTDKTGSIVAAVKGWQDEAFLDSLREKTRRGMRGQVARGLSTGGRAYGYRSVPIPDPARTDPYGQPLVIGSRRVIDKAEAKVVRRIFEMYASGLSAKAITYRLNSESAPPPRPKRGRKVQGWTWTTISGSREKGIGILNNELYRGTYFWNRSGKLRDPETGKRITRRRGKEDWLRVEVPELRIISEELWQRVKVRQGESEKRRTKGQRGGATRHAYLFSGLLRCAECGAHYTARGGGRYVCSFHKNRGPNVCGNSRVVRRDVLEHRLLEVIEQEILTPEAVAYLTEKVNGALQRANHRSMSARRAPEAELREAEREAENIKQAVRHGKATAILLEMLEAVETKIQRLRAASITEPQVKAAVRTLPGLVERYVRDLRSVLGRNTDRARFLLARLLGDVILRPDDQGLVAEVRGNLGVLLEDVPSIGAGSPLLTQPSTVIDRRIVA